ncbi:unnamed protein product [Adineta steineri]|uniref:Major facilitator superfamily (MFS) profile domain-containing protein n=1 Tax=Adineta steineri TaxID=433720 RepID=A0A814LP10_9BILA|nr:unnamed protein product [Adineta steineri]
MVNEELALSPTSLSLETVKSCVTISTESSISIYDLYTNQRRLLILILLSLAGIVLPFSDTVYLPALAEIEHDLHASTVLVDYTISAYLISAGIAGFLWGPLSDRFGRKIILIVTFILFLAFTIVCALARTIAVLLVFRSLQGAVICASFVVGQSAVVDIYPPEKIGFAMGLFLVPLLVGPIIGPFIGGILSSVFGWRSTFIALGIMTIIATLMIFFFVPETHPHLVYQRLSRKLQKNSDDKNTKAALNVRETDIIMKPRFIPPWRSLIFLFDMTLIPHIALCNSNFSILFLLFTVMSNRLTEKPYLLSPFSIGLCYIPTGIGSLTGSLCGGWISDWSAKRFPRAIEGRLIFNLIGSFLCPFGLLLCGWSFHFNLHLAGPLIGSTLFCFGETFMFTSTSAFATIKKPTMAGTILALISSIGFLSSGIGIIVIIPLFKILKFGYLFSILAAIVFLLICISGMVIIFQIRKSNLTTTHSNIMKTTPSSHALIDQSKDIIPIQLF